jgi:hypothetical protein
MAPYKLWGDEEILEKPKSCKLALGFYTGTLRMQIDHIVTQLKLMQRNTNDVKCSA